MSRPKSIKWGRRDSKENTIWDYSTISEELSRNFDGNQKRWVGIPEAREESNRIKNYWSEGSFSIRLHEKEKYKKCPCNRIYIGSLLVRIPWNLGFSVTVKNAPAMAGLYWHWNQVHHVGTFSSAEWLTTRWKFFHMSRCKLVVMFKKKNGVYVFSEIIRRYNCSAWRRTLNSARIYYNVPNI